MAQIYSDFFIYKLADDIRKWYDKHYYPPKYDGPKVEVEHHINLLHQNYNYDKIEGETVEEKRVSLLTSVQLQMDRHFQGDN